MKIPFCLPLIDNDVISEVNDIFTNTGWLTSGPKVRLFEEKIQKKFSLNNFSAVTNGTIALQVAIKALDLKGEIITSPFSWIATVSAIKYEKCTPVFCDINENTFNIDPDKI